MKKIDKLISLAEKLQPNQELQIQYGCNWKRLTLSVKYIEGVVCTTYSLEVLTKLLEIWENVTYSVIETIEHDSGTL